MTTTLNSIGQVTELRNVERCTCGRIIGDDDRRSSYEPHGEPMDYCVWCGEASVSFESVAVCDLCELEAFECKCSE